MKTIKSFYEISPKADKDIDEIFKYTVIEFGVNQAVKYVTEFHAVFNHLLINPKMGLNRLEIKHGLYSITKNKHVVFYRIFKDKIRIIRVLHGSRDLPKYF